ncbi:MAG: YdeI/OmpD-associated family protein [Gemmatimonadaceae bacterium]
MAKKKQSTTGKKNAATDASTRPVRAFKTQKDFEAWLHKNHATSPGIWVRIARKESGKKSLTYQQGVDTALCYGWIDAQKRPESESAWLQRFMPRRPRSIWSRINREKALALIASGRMKPAGLAEVERAKQDGRWEAAYDSASTATVPVDLQNELDRHPRAAEFFKTLDRTNRYAILWRVATAKKAETRARRIAKFIEMLEKGETIH